MTQASTGETKRRWHLFQCSSRIWDVGRSCGLSKAGAVSGQQVARIRQHPSSVSHRPRSTLSKFQQWKKLDICPPPTDSGLIVGISPASSLNAVPLRAWFTSLCAQETGQHTQFTHSNSFEFTDYPSIKRSITCGRCVVGDSTHPCRGQMFFGPVDASNSSSMW